MLFNEFGKKENPAVLLLHGMMQDWHSEYEILKPLEAYYRLIIPAQDGFYDGSKESYAIKSHNKLKKYLKNYDEEIMEGLGHGEFLMKQSEKCCKKIFETLEKQ